MDDLNIKSKSVPVLQAQNVAAGYRRGEAIVHNFALEVYPGEIIGIIGPNGAGKSTVLKALLGLLDERQGQVELPGPEKGGYAYIPELPTLYEELTLKEHLELIGMAYDLPLVEFEQRTEHLLQQFGLQHQRYDYPGGFSKGMRQKIMIMCALLTTPAVYFVDEPFNGLDPFAMQELLQWFKQEKERGAGIVLSTHVLDVGERICDRFILLQGGEILAQGNLPELQRLAGMPGGDLLQVFIHLAGGGLTCS
ncbi:MAG: ABC transporter ATP-binding protein [Methylocystaceae bacterium]